MKQETEFFDLKSFVSRIRRGDAAPGDAGRAALRAVQLLGLSAAQYASILTLERPRWEEPNWGPRQLQRWCRRMSAGMRLSWTLHGEVPPERVPGPGVRGRLLLCNHQGYLDILSVGSLVPMRIVSAAMVRGWPIIGPGAERIGIMFVERTDADSRRGIQEIVRQTLLAGATVLNFPEGANFKGPGMAPFKKGLFRAAAGLPVDIVPITIRYPEAAHAEWVGENQAALASGQATAAINRLSFLEHAINIMSGPPITLRIRIGDTIDCEPHADPNALSSVVREVMLRQLDAQDAEAPRA